MSVLVTGGAGYIGSATVAALLARGESVVVLDDLSAGHRAAVAREVPLYQGDVADRELLHRVIEKHDVQQVVHFAALTSVSDSVARPDRYFYNNTVKVLHLLNLLREHGIGHFVFSSSAAVYGEPEALPIEESHPLRPVQPYGLSKYFVEQILGSYDQAFGLRYAALRYFNACGASPERGEDHAPETHLIPLVLQVALGQRECISVFGEGYPTPDGTCVRDYIHVDDLAHAHLLALDHLRCGRESLKVNLGNGAGYSVRQVIDAARQVTGHSIPVRAARSRPGDPARLVASARRAREVLGWEPQVPGLKEMIASAWQWHRSHPGGYDDRA